MTQERSWVHRNFWWMFGVAIATILLFGATYMVTNIRSLSPATQKVAHTERTIALEREGSAVRNPFSFLKNTLLSSK